MLIGDFEVEPLGGAFCVGVVLHEEVVLPLGELSEMVLYFVDGEEITALEVAVELEVLGGLEGGGDGGVQLGEVEVEVEGLGF